MPFPPSADFGRSVRTVLPAPCPELPASYVLLFASRDCSTAHSLTKYAHANGSSPAYWAAYNGHENCLALLRDAGCDLGQANKRGYTPVWRLASNHGDLNRGLRILLRAGVDATVACQGMTPLQVAESRGHAECASALKAYLTRPTRNVNGSTTSGVSGGGGGGGAGDHQVFEGLDKAAGSSSTSQFAQAAALKTSFAPTQQQPVTLPSGSSSRSRKLGFIQRAGPNC